MTKKELLKAIFEAPEDAELILMTEEHSLKIQGIELATRETRSIFSEDVSLLQPEIRIYLEPKQ